MGRFVPGAPLEGKMEQTSRIYGKDSIERPQSLFVRRSLMLLAKRCRGRWDLVLLRPNSPERPAGVLSNNTTAESTAITTDVKLDAIVIDDTSSPPGACRTRLVFSTIRAPRVATRIKTAQQAKYALLLSARAVLPVT